MFQAGVIVHADTPCLFGIGDPPEADLLGGVRFGEAVTRGGVVHLRLVFGVTALGVDKAEGDFVGDVGEHHSFAIGDGVLRGKQLHRGVPGYILDHADPGIQAQDFGAGSGAYHAEQFGDGYRLGEVGVTGVIMSLAPGEEPLKGRVIDITVVDRLLAGAAAEGVEEHGGGVTCLRGGEPAGRPGVSGVIVDREAGSGDIIKGVDGA